MESRRVAALRRGPQPLLRVDGEGTLLPPGREALFSLGRQEQSGQHLIIHPLHPRLLDAVGARRTRGLVGEKGPRG
jgi:hypothetical protein